MEEQKEKELMCPNKYCYIHKVLQVMPEDREEICHICGFDLKPWKPSKKTLIFKGIGLILVLLLMEVLV